MSLQHYNRFYLQVLFVCFTLLAVLSCQEGKSPELSIEDTWQLISGKTIRGKDTISADYTDGQEVIKIINDSHFTFIRHDTNKGQDSTIVFIAGGGSYTLDGDDYVEVLEYCNIRHVEGDTIPFKITLQNDTLVQIESSTDENGIHTVGKQYFIRMQ